MINHNKMILEAPQRHHLLIIKDNQSQRQWTLQHTLTL